MCKKKKECISKVNDGILFFNITFLLIYKENKFTLYRYLLFYVVQYLQNLVQNLVLSLFHLEGFCALQKQMTYILIIKKKKKKSCHRHNKKILKPILFWFCSMCAILLTDLSSVIICPYSNHLLITHGVTHLCQLQVWSFS